MAGDPVLAARPRDLLDEILQADEVAAQDRKRRERRAFGIGVAAVVVLACTAAGFGLVAWKSIDNNAAQRVAASRRIDRLTASNEVLVAKVDEQSAEIGAMHAQLDAATAQIYQLGGEPVIVNVTSDESTTTTTRPPPTTTTTTTTTTTQPSPQPQPEPPPDGGGFCLGPICIGA